MTVTTTEDTIQQIGNGVTTTVSYPYKFFAKTDLVVINTNLTTLDEVTLVLGTDYTIPNTSDAEGYPDGTEITLASAPDSNTRTTVYRNLPFTQGISYPEDDPFPAKTHEKGLDKLTLLCQQVLGFVNKSLRFSNTSTVSGITVQQPIANRGLKYNSNGTEIINTDLDPDEVFSQAQTQANSATASASSASLSATAAANSATAAANSATSAANSAASTGLPSLVGKALNFLRVKSDETGYETKTASETAQLLTDLIDKDISPGGTISSGNIQMLLNQVKTASITGSTTIVPVASNGSSKPIFSMFVFTTTNASYPSTTIANTTWANGSAPTLSTTGTNIIFLISFNGGASWFAFYNKGGA